MIGVLDYLRTLERENILKIQNIEPFWDTLVDSARTDQKKGGNPSPLRISYLPFIFAEKNGRKRRRESKEMILYDKSDISKIRFHN